ncbi:hypothetical protein [Psychrobacter lutiphocae]|uniref:hypothetical protein n=1 Tax=Psychrobacter lutiphocae TaxID=540500 RepID=UPI000381D6FB|nr:hypothetical protein [Psychrobacter lutiphocae]
MQSGLAQIYKLIKERFEVLKRLGFICLCSVFLTACASTYVEGFDVDFDRDEALIVVKNTDIFKKCIPTNSVDVNSEYFIGVHCIFEGRAPDEYTITYAVWMNDDEDTKHFYGKEIWSFDSGLDENTYITIDGRSVSRDEWMEHGELNRIEAISNLPDSAWQTYTIDSKNRLEKYKGKTPDGQPSGITIPIGWGIFMPSFFPWLQDRVLYLDINIDKNGKVEVEENYHWKNELPDNPYA